MLAVAQSPGVGSSSSSCEYAGSSCSPPAGDGSALPGCRAACDAVLICTVSEAVLPERARSPAPAPMSVEQQAAALVAAVAAAAAAAAAPVMANRCLSASLGESRRPPRRTRGPRTAFPPLAVAALAVLLLPPPAPQPPAAVTHVAVAAAAASAAAAEEVPPSTNTAHRLMDTGPTEARSWNRTVSTAPSGSDRTVAQTASQSSPPPGWSRAGCRQHESWLPRLASTPLTLFPASHALLPSVLLLGDASPPAGRQPPGVHQQPGARHELS